jgi:hypothetical protein
MNRFTMPCPFEMPVRACVVGGEVLGVAVTVGLPEIGANIKST